MEALTPSCRPICGELGHQYVSLTVWKCQHHGAVTLRLSEWRDGVDEVVDDTTWAWDLGPFDTVADARQAIDGLRVRIAAMLRGSGTV